MLESSGTAHATPDGMAQMIIDMDPEDGDAVPGTFTFPGTIVNDNSSFGTIQACARIDNDNVLNQDEDVNADQVRFDLLADDVPVAYAMLAFQAKINHDDSNLTVKAPVQSADGTPGVSMVSRDGNGNESAANQPLPDATIDGTYGVSATDQATGEEEAGDGVLSRIPIEADGASGVYPLTIDAASSFHLDTTGALGGNHYPNALVNGVLAVDMACPLPQDMKLVSQLVTFPGAIGAAAVVPLVIDKVIHNNGPEVTYGYDIVKTINLPPDCTLNGLPNVGPYVITVPMGFVATSVPVNYQENDTVQCATASNHQLTVQNCLVALSPSGDPVAGNNCDVDVVVFTVNGVSDVKITSQTVTGFPAPVAPLPYPRVVAGTSYPITANKTIHNNGPYGPVTVVRTTAAFIAPPSMIGGLSAGDCTIVPPGAGGPHLMAVSNIIPVAEGFTVTCGAGGMGNDTDGDTLIDEDSVDTVDNDGDTFVDEDSAYLVPTVCINNDLDIQDAHVTDPAPEGSAVTMGLVDASELTCTTLALVRPFSPSFTVVQDEDDNPSNYTPLGSEDGGIAGTCSDAIDNGPDGATDAADSDCRPMSAPTDDDCLLTQPCEQLINYQIAPPGMIGTKAETGTECQGAQIGVDDDADTTPDDGCNGSPLAGTIIVTPGDGTPAGAYYITNSGAIPNGDMRIRATFSVTVDYGGATPLCNNLLGPASFNMTDGELPIAWGGASQSLTQPDLVNPFTWPERLEASPLYRAFNVGGPNYGIAPFDYSGAPVWARGTALVPGLNTPANFITFNLGLGGWYELLITGDPSLPPNPASPQACAPLTVAADLLGETASGTDLRVCNVIKGGTNPADYHYIAGSFQRTDTGETTTIPDPNKCTAENDVEVTKADNLVVNAPADLDHTETINITVTNGQVPGNVDVSVSLVGPAICDPQLVPDVGDVLTGPIVVGANQSTRLDWTEIAMAANEVRNLSRDYTVNCPMGGPYNMQVVVNAGAAFPDPDINNNQAENHPVINVNDNDADNDTVPNNVDNCPNDANPNQADADNDGLGDVCDSDDDNDGNPDATDGCDTAAEDVDGIDDSDGCPDTDSAIKNVVKQTAFNVDVSTSNSKGVTVTVANQGNVVASLEVTILIRSDAGVCEAHWVPAPGDGVAEDNIGGVLHSQLTVILPNMLPGEQRDIVRNYNVHCFTKSYHDNAIRFEVGVAPVYPVSEESDDVLDNVWKQNIDITAFSVADVKKLGLIIPDPAMQVGVDAVQEVRSVFHNNGPFGPVTVNDTISGSGPADCTVVGPAGTNPTQVVLPVSVTVTLDQTFTLNCSQPSFHTFCFDDEIEVATLHVRDPNPNNNSAQLCVTNPVTTTADAKITATSVTAPAANAAGVNFNVSVNATAHNNGPYGPLSGDVTLNLSVPADCTKVPAGSQSQAVNLAVSSAVNVSKMWLVNCSTPSNHQLDGSSSLTVSLPLHVTDPSENSNGNGGAVTVITQAVDKDITSLNAQQEPRGTDLEGLALVEDRRWADLGDVNGDSANVTTVPAVPGVSYELLARIATLANTNTPAYNVNVASAGTCGPASNNNYVEAPETAGTANVIKASVEAVGPAPFSTCNVSITVTLSASASHYTDADNDVANVLVDLCADQDDDGVCDTDDNCPTDYNPGQEDTDLDGIGDVCDDTPNHDDGVKYCLKFGPAPINLSDNGGTYMWVLCEIGNFTDHDDSVVITAANDLVTATLPNGCSMATTLLIPGRVDFVLLANEQKFVLYRTRFECHAPAQQQVLPISVTVSIDHVQILPDGDDTNTSNDSVTITQNIIVGPPPPP